MSVERTKVQSDWPATGQSPMKTQQSTGHRDQGKTPEGARRWVPAVAVWPLQETGHSPGTILYGRKK